MMVAMENLFGVPMRNGRNSSLRVLLVLAAWGCMPIPPANADEPAAPRSNADTPQGTGKASGTQPKHVGALPKVRVAADGRSFVTADGRAFVPMGINYYRPGMGWAPRLWLRFDAQATRQDFVRMKALGVNCVRVFLSHGSFFQKPDALTPEGLAKFDQFLAIAEETGIYVHPTGPDGWEEFPAWAQCDRIADDGYLAALETFWRQFGGRYRGRSVIFAYDLRNEPGVAWNTPTTLAKWNAWLQKRYGSAAKNAKAWGVPLAAIQWGHQEQPLGDGPPRSRPLLDFHYFREGLADDWTRRQAATIKSVDPEALVTVGFLSGSVPAHETWGGGYSCFRPARQTRFLDFLEVQLYPTMSGYSDEAEQRNLAHCESVAREVAAAGKPLVIAEFGWYGGGPIDVAKGRYHAALHLPAVSQEQQARWCRKLIETTRGLAVGWLNWGLYDHPEANDCAQRTGLLTVDGQPKAWAGQFHELATALDGRPIAPARLGPRPRLDWGSCTTSSAARRKFAEEYYRAFQADCGRPPSEHDPK